MTARRKEKDMCFIIGRGLSIVTAVITLNPYFWIFGILIWIVLSILLFCSHQKLKEKVFWIALPFSTSLVIVLFFQLMRLFY